MPNGGPGQPIPQPPPGNSKSCDPYMNGGASSTELGGGGSSNSATTPPDSASATINRQTRKQNGATPVTASQDGPLPSGGTLPNLLPSTEPGQPGPPKAQPRRKMTREEIVALRRHQAEEATTQRTVNKDCFIIPQNNLERFLPDGITVIRLRD